jgi:ABC-type cobalamin transport system ATPase subunit
MTNSSKSKGSAFEKQVVDFLNGIGLHADRMPAGSTLDRGDISLDNWTIEAKNHRAITLASFVDEALAEQINGATDWHVVIAKRVGKGSVDDSYAVMTVGQWGEIVLALEELDERRRAEIRTHRALVAAGEIPGLTPLLDLPPLERHRF